MAKVRDYILNPRNDRLKKVLLELVNDLEAEDIDRDAMRWMIDQIESGEIGMNYLFEEE